PGFSMTQIPIRVRLYAAASLALAVYFLVGMQLDGTVDMSNGALFPLIFREFVIGASLAIPVRFLFLCLSFLGEITVQYMGLNPIPGIPIGDDQGTTTLAALFNITAIVLMLSTGLLEGFVLALANSYQIFTIGASLPIGNFLSFITTNLDNFFEIVMRLGAPIVIYTVVLNMLAGLVNKLTPQIPIYFVSVPFLICGGFVLLMWVGDDMMFLFTVEVKKLIMTY
ncbi:MAG: flagellar biosynthetic protein FliR, partial [Pseudomonadota bacterium]